MVVEDTWPGWVVFVAVAVWVGLVSSTMLIHVSRGFLTTVTWASWAGLGKAVPRVTSGISERRRRRKLHILCPVLRSRKVWVKWKELKRFKSPDAEENERERENKTRYLYLFSWSSASYVLVFPPVGRDRFPS